MPYITAEAKQEIEAGRKPATAGELTYVIYKAMIDALPPTARYADFPTILGAAESAQSEFYRRKVAPYEDGAIERNGDVLAG